MRAAEAEVAELAGDLGFTLVREPGKKPWLRSWDGTTTVGFRSLREVKLWLVGYSYGANAHELGCRCGRVACNHRNACLGVSS